MIGYIITMFIFLFAVSMAGGIILGHFMWNPPMD